MTRKKKFDKLSTAEIFKIKEHKTKELNCSKCGKWVESVSMEAESVICHTCTTLMVPIEKRILQQTSGFPRGWKLYAEFIHADGRVFYRGVEDVKKKGTLSPTDMNKIKEKALANKKTKKERVAKKEAKLAKHYDKKQELKKKIKETLVKAAVQLTDEDKVLLSAIKKDIILDVISENGKFEALDKKNNKYGNIISNQAKLKYAFNGSKKVIGIKIKSDTVKWKVYNGIK